MSVNLIETHDSRDFTIDAAGARGTWRYVGIVKGEADPEAALELAVRNAAPFFWQGLARQSVTATPNGGGVYTVEVPYEWERPNTAAQDPTQSPGPTDGPGGGAPSGTPSGPATDDDPVGAEVTLEIGSRPPTLYTSLATLDSGGFGVVVPPGAVVAAPDYQRAINVTDKDVEGVDLDDTGEIITISKTFDYVTWAYFQRLISMRWKTNNATWFRFGRREVAFLGATLKTGKDGRWDATFRFGMKPTTTITAGKLRDDGVNKLPQYDVTYRGWDYLWVRYRPQTDAVANATVRVPAFFYIEQILEEADFTLFGIGG